MLVVRWEVNEQLPLGFSIIGQLNHKHVPTVDFLTFPKKVETVQDVFDHLGNTVPKEGVSSSIRVYNEGERIVYNRDEGYKGENYAMTDQYYLIGSFEGEGTKKDYWLYGNNAEKQSKTTVSSQFGIGEAAKEDAGK